MLIVKILSIINSYIRIFLFKSLYFSNIEFAKILSCYLGSGSKLVLNSKYSSISVGKKLICRDYVRIKCTKGKINIGNNVFFNNSCSVNCRLNINIGDNCIFGENVKIYDHDHIYNRDKLIRENGFVEKSVSIGRNVWIGSNSIILKGVTIGDNVVIAAGTIVKKDVETGKLVYNEAKINAINIDGIN